MVYVMSDLHGYPLEKIQGLLAAAGFSEADYCFILGDVVDRGPEGVAILQWLMYQSNIQLLLGNHEAMMRSCRFLFDEVTQATLEDLNAEKLQLYSTWLKNGAQPTIDALAKLDADSRNDIFDFLQDLPLYETVEVGGRVYILTHSGLGGFQPGKALEEYEPHDLLWNRPGPGERYFEGATVVFGHTPTHHIAPESRGKILVTDTWIDIDTGVASGLKPTLLRLEDMAAF